MKIYFKDCPALQYGVNGFYYIYLNYEKKKIIKNLISKKKRLMFELSNWY